MAVESEVKRLIAASERRVRADLSELKAHVSRESAELAAAVAAVAKSRPVVSLVIFALGAAAGAIIARF